MYSGVPTSMPSSVNSEPSVSGRAIALAIPKSMISRHGPIVVDGDEHVRWLQIAMDDPFLVRVLDAFAELNEQLETLAHGQALAIAVRAIDSPRTYSITKYGRPSRRRPRVEHLGDRRVVHQRERLPLGLEARDHLRRVHARLDDLDARPAAAPARSAAPARPRPCRLRRGAGEGGTNRTSRMAWCRHRWYASSRRRSERQEEQAAWSSPIFPESAGRPMGNQIESCPFSRPIILAEQLRRTCF